MIYSKQNITRIVVEHWKLKKHLFSMGTVQETKCRSCSEEKEIPVHILCYCETYANLAKQNEERYRQGRLTREYNRLNGSSARTSLQKSLLRN